MITLTCAQSYWDKRDPSFVITCDNMRSTFRRVNLTRNYCHPTRPFAGTHKNIATIYVISFFKNIIAGRKIFPRTFNRRFSSYHSALTGMKMCNYSYSYFGEWFAFSLVVPNWLLSIDRPFSCYTICICQKETNIIVTTIKYIYL